MNMKKKYNIVINKNIVFEYTPTPLLDKDFEDWQILFFSRFWNSLPPPTS